MRLRPLAIRRCPGILGRWKFSIGLHESQIVEQRIIV
jgi:hypothetical protein